MNVRTVIRTARKSLGFSDFLPTMKRIPDPNKGRRIIQMGK